MGFKPMVAGALPSAKALFSAPVVPKKVERETKKSDDESEEVAPMGCVLGGGWWSGVVG